MTPTKARRCNYPIDRMFLDRWSPRAFNQEEITEAELMTIFEAARWAPSSYNSQPWRFIYARRGTPAWDGFLDLLVPLNRSWAKDAAALVILISNPLMRPPGADKDVPSHSHSLDAGTASGFLALQANRLGWFVHGMGGFDMERASAELNVPAGHRVEAAYAIGRRGDPATLPDQLRAGEAPNDRKPLSELIFEGRFPASA